MILIRCTKMVSSSALVFHRCRHFFFFRGGRLLYFNHLDIIEMIIVLLIVYIIPFSHGFMGVPTVIGCELGNY